MRGAPLSSPSFYTVVIHKRLLFLALLVLAAGALVLKAYSVWEKRYPTPPPERIAQLMQRTPAPYGTESATTTSGLPPTATGIIAAHPSLAATAAPATAGLADPAQTSAPLSVGQPAPDFSLPDLSGKQVIRSSFQGRPVIVYFWATWCHYCRESMPHLEAAKAQHQADGLEVLAINILESADRVRAHARRHGISLPILLDLEAKATQAYLVRATPSYYFIDPEGVLRDVVVGSLEPEALQERIESILPPTREETP